MAFTLTPSGGSTVSYADPTDGFAAGGAAKFWTKKPLGAKQWAVELSDAPSTDGFLVSRHGFRGLPMGPLEFWYINTTEAACIAAFVADRDALENKKLAVVVPGWSGTFDNCNIARFTPENPKMSGANLYRMRCTMVLSQDRTT